MRSLLLETKTNIKVKIILMFYGSFLLYANYMLYTFLLEKTSQSIAVQKYCSTNKDKGIYKTTTSKKH